jgi:hypothetical protein
MSGDIFLSSNYFESLIKGKIPSSLFESPPELLNDS